jgi:hypothetical protein
MNRITFVILALAATLMAQENLLQSLPESKPSDPQSPVQSLMEIKPGPEIQKLLNTFTGLWETSEKMEPTNKFPEGVIGHGQAFFRPGPGGYSMIEDHRSQSLQGPYSARGTFWWDEKAKGFRFVWCDSTIPSGCLVSNGVGNWQGADFVLEDEQQRDGKKIRSKNTYSSVTANSFVQTIDESENGGSMKRKLTINWSRGANSNAPVLPPAAPPAKN